MASLSGGRFLVIPAFSNRVEHIGVNWLTHDKFHLSRYRISAIPGAAERGPSSTGGDRPVDGPVRRRLGSSGRRSGSRFLIKEPASLRNRDPSPERSFRRIPEHVMAAQSRLPLVTAALVGSILSAATASAQGKRPWIDPPANVGAPSDPSPADRKPTPVQPPSDKPAARSETPSTHSVESAAPVAPERAAPAASAPRRVAAPAARSRPVSAARKSAAKRMAAPVASRSLTTGRRQPLRTATARSNSRAAPAERPLELMTLQTIELPNGRRFNVLTRPRPTMFESVLIGP